MASVTLSPGVSLAPTLAPMLPRVSAPTPGSAECPQGVLFAPRDQFCELKQIEL